MFILNTLYVIRNPLFTYAESPFPQKSHKGTTFFRHTQQAVQKSYGRHMKCGLYEIE